ncbi:hypothetical protein C5L39_08425 [Corynebacterium alimapuense]|uniref:TetR family transcriptional regulator n=2 Tax=Corynebacterium alimapuense TaxID=1576874 RepID=A0A3M8K7H3_9CORY|nr:hypothetical protein C5L39_08425 [Corynebacterium alimapuense]
MDCKDEAILGIPQMTISEDRRAIFIDTPSDNLVRLALELMLDTLNAAENEDIEHGADEEFLATLRNRRREILSAEPSAALMSLNRFREQAKMLHQLIVDHLTAHPGDRKLPDHSIPVEASIINGLIRESVWLHLTHTAHTRPSDRSRLLPEAGETITTLAKELTW